MPHQAQRRIAYSMLIEEGPRSMEERCGGGRTDTDRAMVRRYLIRSSLSLAVAFSALLVAGPAASQDALPDAFPREGAVKILSNGQLDAWDVTWRKDLPTPMHLHRHDYLGVELENSRFRVTAPDGRTREIDGKAGQLWFLERGKIHVETGLSQNPLRHAIVVELKNAAGPAAANTTEFPMGPTDTRRAPDLESDRVSMWNVALSPELAEPIRFLARSVAVIFKADCTIEWRRPDASRRVESYSQGRVEFLEAGQAFGMRALNGSAELTLVEFKR